jgi:hypothetical protein
MRHSFSFFGPAPCLPSSDRHLPPITVTASDTAVRRVTHVVGIGFERESRQANHHFQRRSARYAVCVHLRPEKICQSISGKSSDSLSYFAALLPTTLKQETIKSQFKNNIKHQA